MLFARIELRGEPDLEIYNSLHKYMHEIGWSQTVESGGRLPQGTYQRTVPGFEEVFLIETTARFLKTDIERKIWPDGAIILVSEPKAWALEC